MSEIAVHQASSEDGVRRLTIIELDLESPVAGESESYCPVHVRRLTVYRHHDCSFERKVTLTNGAEVWADLVKNEWIQTKLEYMCGYADGLLADHNSIGDVK